MKTIFDDRCDAERGSERGALRPRDGIVTSAAARPRTGPALGRSQAKSTWIVVARTDEAFEDFFLDSPFGDDAGAPGEDPIAWICRDVNPDGTLRMGAIDLSNDRFVSDVLSDELRDALRKVSR